MRHFAKLCGLIGAGALFAATAPACAGAHFAGGGGRSFVRPHAAAGGVRPFFNAHDNERAVAPLERGNGVQSVIDRTAAQGYFGGGEVGAAFYQGPFVRSPGFFPGCCGRGFGGGWGYGGGGGGYATGAYPDAPYYGPVYPIGYDGASYEPTGYGVVYNVPPNPTLVRPGPEILLRSGHHWRRMAIPYNKHILIVRGGGVSAAY